MPEEEWNVFTRDSRIQLGSELISHPIEANIWQMKIEEQVEYLKSIAVAGCNLEQSMPEDFVDWIYWKLGKKIAEDYMIPYNQKMFGVDLNRLGTYWMEKLPSVSFEETLLSCLTKKAYGSQPGHAQFYYPKKYGYGELWLRMAGYIQGNIEYEKPVRRIDFKEKKVTTADGCSYQADTIITTIPWAEFETLSGMPEAMKKDIQELKSSSLQTEYFSENLDTEAQWIYCPDAELSYHRILVRHNFCPRSRGYWTETNQDRVSMESPNNNFKYRNQYAYPLNTIGKPEIMSRLLSWCRNQKVYGLGRWGEHQHYNSDVTVERALQLAEEMAK